MAGGIGSGHGIVPIDDDVSYCVIPVSLSHTLAERYASGEGPSLLRNRAMLLLRRLHGQPKRAAPNSPHHSRAMVGVALGSFHFCY